MDSHLGRCVFEVEVDLPILDKPVHLSAAGLEEAHLGLNGDVALIEDDEVLLSPIGLRRVILDTNIPDGVEECAGLLI